MAMEYISAGWKTALEATFPPTERFFIDFRRIEYPEITGTPTFTEITSGDNKAGRFNLTGGWTEHLLDMPDKFTLEIECYPNFDYDTADDQYLVGWYIDSNNYFIIFYDASEDKFRAELSVAGSSVYLESGQFDDGTSHTDINQWLIITVAIDTTTGDTSGSQLWIDRSSEDTAWSGNVPAIGAALNLLQIRHQNETSGDYKINYLKIFDSYIADDTAVGNAFEDVKYEEIFWDFNGQTVGKTRCNITSHVRSWTYQATQENDVGSQTSNRASVELWSRSGEFADDQYAAFDPTSDQFNGTSSQKYLQQRCGIFIESWYGNDFEPLFIGFVDSNRFMRSTPKTKMSRVNISCYDYVETLAQKFFRNAVYWQNKDITDPTESNSLFHLMAREVTQKEVYNYAGNSSFAAATIADSWASGGSCALTRDTTHQELSSYTAKAVFSGADEFYQDLTFPNDDLQLSEEDNWTFYLYVKADATFSGNLKLAERDSDGENDSSTTTILQTGSEGWEMYSVTHEITDGDSDRLRYGITASTGTVYATFAMLIMGKRSRPYYVENTNEGTSGAVDTDDAEVGSYDYVGFVADQIDYEVEYALIPESDNLWEHLKQLADAGAARYFGLDKSGVFAYRSYITGVDPTKLETLSIKHKQLSTRIELETANKIRVHGVKIQESSNPLVLWIASACGAFAAYKTKLEYLYVEIEDGETFPSEDFFAKYGEN